MQIIIFGEQDYYLINNRSDFWGSTVDEIVTKSLYLSVI